MKHNTICSQARADFPTGWWRSWRWWGSAIKRDATEALLVIAPALLPHRAVFAVRNRRDPEQLSRLDGEGFVYGFGGALALIAMLVWTTTGSNGPLPFRLGLGGFLVLNAAVSGTVVAVLIAARLRHRKGALIATPAIFDE
jgi:hypothetical protein